MKKLLAALLCTLLLAGCGAPAENVPPSTAPETTAATSVPAETATATVPETKPEAAQSMWNLVEGLPFTLSSGAGGWFCTLEIDSQGNFTGEYSDSNMGETGEGYPNGTIYRSQFRGKFSEPYINGPANYLVHVEVLEDLLPLENVIENGTRICQVHADQLEGDPFFLYLPGKATSELQEDVLHWLPFPDREKPRLSSYVLENHGAGLSFVSAPASPWLAGQNLLQLAREEADFLQAGADIPDATQTDLNETARVVYECWDKALNDLWSMLKDNLSQQDMEALLKAQRQWIDLKEEAAESSRKEADGGTMAPMNYYITATKWTEDRCRVLADLLPDSP